MKNDIATNSGFVLGALSALGIAALLYIHPHALIPILGYAVVFFVVAAILRNPLQILLCALLLILIVRFL